MWSRGNMRVLPFWFCSFIAFTRKHIIKNILMNADFGDCVLKYRQQQWYEPQQHQLCHHNSKLPINQISKEFPHTNIFTKKYKKKRILFFFHTHKYTSKSVNQKQIPFLTYTSSYSHTRIPAYIHNTVSWWEVFLFALFFFSGITTKLKTQIPPPPQKKKLKIKLKAYKEANNIDHNKSWRGNVNKQKMQTGQRWWHSSNFKY